MLSLREEQVEALDQPMCTAPIPRLAEHLLRSFPAVAGSLGATALHEVIGHGIVRALDHGIRTQRGVCRYLNLMFVFGRDFDRDPRLPWADEILSGARVHRHASTIELLCQEALLHEADGQGLHGGGA